MGTECDVYDTSFNSISESSFSCVSSSVGLDLCSARSSISNDKVVPPLPCNVNKPHKANDAAWEAVRAVRCVEGPIGLSHLRLGKKVGSGDIGKVYMCRLRGFEGCDYAVKVVDKEALFHRNKAHRAEVERQILSTLDHPFLPTLYAHFDASHYSCLLMDYCSGGDLHSLRQRQRSRRFSARSARYCVFARLVFGRNYVSDCVSKFGFFWGEDSVLCVFESTVWQDWFFRGRMNCNVCFGIEFGRLCFGRNCVLLN